MSLCIPARATPTLQLGVSDATSASEYTRSAVLTWDAQRDLGYTVQAATTLRIPDWKTLDLVVSSSNGPVRWMAPESLRDQRFYRLILPQPEIFSVEPSFVDSSDPSAVLYILGQLLPTNAIVVIGGETFTPTIVNSNGVWGIVSLNGLPPGTPIIDLMVLDGTTSNVVTTVSLQNPVLYGSEMTTEQLQGPPDDPPATPAGLIKTKTKSNQSNDRLVKTKTKSNQSNDRLKTKTKSNQSNDRLADGGDGDDDFFGALMKAKEKANRTKCTSNLRLATGELDIEEVDLEIPGRGFDFIWTRTYRSRTGSNTEQGHGWDFSYNLSLSLQPDGTAQLRSGNGRTDTFYPNGTNGWARDEFFMTVGDLNRDGQPDVVACADGTRITFNPLATGGAQDKVTSIQDRNGNRMTFDYDVAGRLATIVDTLGRTNTVSYNPAGQIESLTDFSGRVVRYEYDLNGDLTAAISPPITGTPTGNDFPGGKTNRYTYTSGFADPRLNHNLTSVIDPKGQIWLQVVYQTNQSPASLDFDSVAYTSRGNDKKDLWRGRVTPSPTNGFAFVRCVENDGVGNVIEYYYDSRHRLVRMVEFTGRANPNLPTTPTDNRPTGKLRADDPDSYETRWTWNADSLCTRVIFPRGDALEVIYERAFNQNDSRSNRRQAGNPRVLRELACCSGADLDGDGVLDITERAWHFEHDPNFGSGSALCYDTTCPGKVVYDLNSIVRLGNGVAINTKGTGADKGRVLPTVNKVAIKTKGTGADKNRMASPGSGGDCDDTDDDCDSFFTSIIDPRGVLTTYTYDAKGNQTAWKHHDIQGLDAPTLEFAYNPYGQLTAVTNAADGTGYRRVDTVDYYTNGPQAGYCRQFTVDAQGPIVTLCSYEYDSRGNLKRFVDANTNDWLFTYNALDQCIARQTPSTSFGDRIATTYTYDANDNLVSTATDLQDGAGVFLRTVTTSHEYDALDRCIATADQVAKNQFVTNRFFYDANDNLVSIHSPLAVSGTDPNNMVAFEYDERGLLFQAMVAPGSGSATNRYDYDEDCDLRRVSKVDAFAIKMKSYTYDGFGRLRTVIDAMSNVVTYAYDRNDNLVFARRDAEPEDDPGNTGNLRYHEWRWSYDSLNRCVQSVGAWFDPLTQSPIGDGASVSLLTYAPNGACLSSTDDNGHTTRFAYDTAGRLASVTDSKTNVTSYTYDAAGNVLTVTQSDRSELVQGLQQSFVIRAYDKLHRLLRVADNVGNTNSYFYDSLDRLVRHQDARGAWSGREHDDLGRVILIEADLNGDGDFDSLDAITAQAWDDNSRLVSQTDDNTNTTFFTYDSLDRCVAITNADGTTQKLVWSPRSNLVRQEDANGTVISNSFDLLDRCVRRDITPGAGVAATTTFETFSYNGASSLVQASNDVSFVIMGVDSFGNPGPVNENGRVTQHSYDGVGNRTSMTYPSGRLVTYAYDALDQVASVSSTPGGVPPTVLAQFAYEGPGRVGRITRANNLNTRFAWNGLVSPPNASGDFGWQQVSGINHQLAGGGAVIDRRSAAYDQNQNKILRAQIIPFFGGGPMITNDFVYDALDRLTQWSRRQGSPNDVFRTIGLDGNGNRVFGSSNGVARPYIMDPTAPVPADFQMNQYTLTPFGSQAYDENGNLIMRVTASGQLQYQYDCYNRLVQVNDLSSGSLEPVASYAYDALGRRISKTVYPPLPLSPVTTEYTHGGDCDDRDDDYIEERENGTLRKTIVFPHALETSGRIMFTSTGEIQYQHCDELGHVLALTGAAGNVIERYDYDDFGAPHFLSPDGFSLGTNASPAGNPFLYFGLQWELETGFYYGHSQGANVGVPAIYDPQLGRSMNGGMPNRISMTVTAPKQTQGATFGEKVNAGLHAAGSALSSSKLVEKATSGLKDTLKTQVRMAGGGGGGGGGGSKAQDHNSSRSNKTASGKAQDHNSSRSNKTSSSIDHGGGGGGGGSKAQDHNSSRSNKTASGMDPDGNSSDGLGGPMGSIAYPQKVGAYRLYGPGSTHWGSARLTRPVLKEFFEKGDKPTQAQFSTISNVLKTKHDTAKNSIGNIR
jgi:YD repeat-containing protein